MRLLSTLILAMVTLAPNGFAADFSFFSILRAGVSGNGDWEIGTGPNGNTILNSANYQYNQTTPGWSNNLDQQFRIGYTQATNTVYATVWGATGTAYTSVYNPVGGATAGTSGTWSIDTNGIYVRASARSAPTAISVSNLELSSAVNVLQPMTATSLYASQPTGANMRGNTAPIVFSAAANGGDWYLDGVVRFSGLAAYTTGGARRSELHFGLTANYADTPEPAAMLLVSAGIVAMALLRRRRSMV